MTELTQAALRVVKSLGMVGTSPNVKAVERAIEAEIRLSGGTVDEAAGLIIQAATRDVNQGEAINRFYFDDARWRNKKKAAEVVQFPNCASTERKSASEACVQEGRPDVRVRTCPSCRSGVLYFCRRRDDAFFIKCSNPRCTRTESVPTDSDDIERMRAEYEAADKCQICGAAMIEKVGPGGPFLGCGAWPHCNFSY